LLAAAGRPLAGVVATGVLASLLVLAQAWAVTDLVVAAVRGRGVAWPALVVVAVLAVRGLVTWIAEVCAARSAAVVGTDLRTRLMARVTDPAVRERSGELAVLVTRGVAAAEPYVTRYLPALVLAVVLPPFTLLAMASQDLLSAGIVVATLPLIPVFGALVGLATRDRAREQWRAMASLSGHFVDVVRGLPTLVAFRRARAQSERIRAVTERYRIASMRTLRIAFASSAVLELVATLSVALVAVTVGVRLAAGSLDLHTALVVLLLAPEAYWPLRRVGAEFHAAAEGVATFEAACELLATPDARDERSGAAVLGSPLVVEDLSVRYPGRVAAALEGLSAVIAPRGVTVVTGPSGAGKSTLLAALAGLVATESGQVSAGGRPVGGTAWQRQVAWLPQRPVFVSGSIADNLRLADPEADDAALWDALRRVALEERVQVLPGGLAAPLGEDGTTLSGGERARLTLARVIVADRPWVFLDEPTAHLDPVTEQVIADVVVDLGRTSGVVVVALADHLIAIPLPRLAGTSTAIEAAHRGQDRPLPADSDDDVVVADRRPWPLAVSTLLGAGASASGVALTATAGWLIVQASTRPGVLTLLVAIVGVRTFGLARPALRYAERLHAHDAALRLLARRRVEVYESVVPLVPGRLGRRRGDVLAAIVDDVDSVVDRELRVRAPLRSFAAVAVLVTVVAFAVLPAAGVVTALTCLLAGAGGWLVAQRGAALAEADGVTARAELSVAALEAVQVAPELTMWQATDRSAAGVAELSRRIGRAGCRAAAWVGAARGLVLLVAGAGVAAVSLVAAPALREGALSAPLLALLVLVPLALSDVMAGVADAGALSARTAAAERRLDTLAHRAPAVRDTAPGRTPPTTHLVLQDARGRWAPHAPVTAPATLSLGPGERVGLIGPSGTGKSTVAALALRFLDPAGGTVTLGGLSLRSIGLDDVRRRVGLVDDDPHVFATTLAENVRLARPDATDAEVEAALRRAHLGGWLDDLPEGLDTWLGDGHAAVSGGERARIAIARSVLADQEVLVLDEPTAHLDHPTAAALAEELMAGERRQAVLWITHAAVGLDLVDRVVDLGDALGEGRRSPADGTGGGAAGASRGTGWS
jgi:ATP-binding cassette subfamily C protein CydCD